MSVSGDALGAIGLWLTRKERKKDRDNAALNTLLRAVVATQVYVANRRRGAPPDVNSEADLTSKWAEAAVAIRHTDDPARRLQFKSEYWTNPSTWSSEEIISNGTHLSALQLSHVSCSELDAFSTASS